MLLLSIIAREFKQSARRKRMHWLRIALGCGIGTWFALVALRNTLGGAEALGRAVYDAVVFPLAYGVMLLAPALAAPAIATERREDTLGLLFLTKLKPIQIAVAKFTAVLLEVFAFMLLTFPLLCLPVLFGGLEGTEVISDALIILALIVGCTALGILASAWIPSVTMAFLCAIAVLLVFDAAMMFVGEFSVQQLAATRGVRLSTLVRSYSAVYEPGHGIFNLSAFFVDPNVSMIKAAALDLLLASAMAIVFVVAASWRIARLSSGRMGPSLFSYDRFLRRIRERALLPVAGVCVGVVCLSLMGFFGTVAHLPAFQQIMLGIPYLTFLGHTILLVAIIRRIAGEKENRTMESLLATPLTNFSLLWRAVQGALRRCWGWLLVFYAPITIFALGSRFRLSGFLACDIVVGISFVVAFGTFAGCYARNLRQALGWGVGLLGIATLLPEITSRRLGRGWYIPRGWIDFEPYFWTSVAFVALAGCVFWVTLKHFRFFAARQ